MELPRGTQGIVVGNIACYQGGKTFWGGGMPSRADDGVLEVMGLMGAEHIAAIHMGSEKARSLGQGSDVVISIRSVPPRGMEMQVDGEPWLQPPGDRDCTIQFCRSKGSVLWKV